jgi:hypothetical protein
VDVVRAGAQVAGALALVGVDDQPPDIDRAVLAGEGRGGGGSQGVDREAEIAGQQVPGTAWKQTQRDAGGDELLRHRPDGPVASEGAHQTGAVANGLARLAEAGIVLGRLDQRRRLDARRGGRVLENLAHVGEVDLGRVDDDDDIRTPSLHPRTVARRLRRLPAAVAGYRRTGVRAYARENT